MTEDADAIGVASEPSDVILDPVNRRLYVQETKVLRIRGANELGGVGLTEHIDAIVECNDDEVIVVPDEVTTVVNLQVALKEYEIRMKDN